MKYTGLLAAVLALLCLLCTCNTQGTPNDSDTAQSKEYGTTDMQLGAQYQSSWVLGISKSAASQNSAVADWMERCALPERDDIGHYVLHNAVENGDGTLTHHLLLYRSATEQDAKEFTVDFSASGNVLTVTPTYTSSDESQYGYDLIYLTLRADATLELSVELLVDGDYPGQIQTTTPNSITPDTFGAQTNE